MCPLPGRVPSLVAGANRELTALIESAVQEIETCLGQGSRPVNPLSQAIWTLSPEELKVVNYAITVPDLQTLCQSWVSYSSNLQSLYERFPAPKDLFPAVKRHTVELYDLESQYCTQHSLSVDFGEGISSIQVDKCTV